jgi:hypothetical protein
MWGSAPDRRPDAQAADVTARLRPDKAAFGASLIPSRCRADDFAAYPALFFAYSYMNSARLSPRGHGLRKHGPGSEHA